MILPLRDNILIDPLPGAGMVGLLHIPETKRGVNQTYHYAMVVAAGPKVERARVGTKILCSELFGVPIEHEGKKYRIGRERDCIGVCEELAFHAPPLEP